MTAELMKALSNVEQAAALVFSSDPTVRSVGVGKVNDGYGFIAIRNARAILPMGSRLGLAQLPMEVEGIPVEYVSSQMDPVQLIRVPHSGAGRSVSARAICQQERLWRHKE